MDHKDISYKNGNVEIIVEYKSKELSYAFFSYFGESIKWRSGIGFYNLVFWEEKGWRGYEVNSSKSIVSNSEILYFLKELKANVPDEYNEIFDFFVTEEAQKVTKIDIKTSNKNLKVIKLKYIFKNTIGTPIRKIFRSISKIYNMIFIPLLIIFAAYKLQLICK